MIRSFNYTNRKRLKRQDVQVRLTQQQKSKLGSFEVLLKLEDYALPKEGRVYVEAYRRSYDSAAYMRFPFGTVSNYQPPSDRQLYEFRGTDAMLFRVKIVSELGKLLAEADQIRPISAEEQVENRRTLLYVKSDDLGAEVWKLDLQQEMPVLLVNNRITDKYSLVRSSVFQSLVYPGILREILRELLRDELPDLEGTDWRALWARFALQLTCVTKFPESLDTDSGSNEWIDSCVSAFAVRMNSLEQYLSIEELK